MIYLLFVAAFVLLFVFTASYICYRMVFYSPKKRRVLPVSQIPGGEKIARYKEQIKALKADISNAPYEPVSVIFFDGLVLRGNYYEFAGNAPLEIIFHGYKSTKTNDCSGGYAIGMKLGINILTVDQRAHDGSEGSTITFGINERHDCL